MRLSLLAASVVFGQGHAPVDVPVHHWAHNAVEELFAAGILHGYSGSEQLFVQEKIGLDISFLRDIKRELKENGALVGYPEGMIRGGIPESPYEFAVAMHAAWANLDASAGRDGSLPLEHARFLPEISKALNMLTPQLEKMGAGMKPIFVSLNRMAMLPLHMEANASPDESLLTKLASEILTSKFLTAYPEDRFGQKRPMSNYEEAVLFHAVLHQMISREGPIGKREINWMPGVVLAVSMRSKELQTMGADIAPMIDALNKRRQELFSISSRGQ